MMSERVDAFIVALQKNAPKLTIEFKDESWFMNLCGNLAFFNSSFMTDYATTIGNTIYLPSRTWYAAQIESDLLQLISHEYVHVRDAHSLSFLYSLLYVFPISLIPLLAVLFFVLPWPVVTILMFACLAPLPAPGRMYFESRGYKMSMFTTYALAKESQMSEDRLKSGLTEMVNYFNQEFTSFDYYLMWPFGIKDKLTAAANSIDSGEIIQESVIYSEVADALVASKSQ